ncbi:glycosyltransferase family 90 protein [Schizophyllum amplum]|uniref:Glycosyltransferase family 90 protein n=1 Tax=Schizophyllum amplum TaxID=97359 RepID=A0A550CLQ3_9AGAR|nr:glycosyltransferase family 90 protein [Auriculariopsis ampla]
MPAPRACTLPPSIMLRRLPVLYILSAPKTRRLLRVVLLVAAFYVILSFSLGSHVDYGQKTGLQAKARHASVSAIKKITAFTRGASPSGRRKTKQRLANPATGKHKYHQNGLLVVDPSGAHPIYELMARAEKQWMKKQAKASRTLEQAVKEYRRRYKRNPPKGFDIWWDFVSKNNVKLPDEYDQIYWDFEHLWGVYPPDLIDLQREMQDAHTDDWYSIGRNEDGHVDVVATSFMDGHDHLVANSIPVLTLLKQVEDYLPDNFTIMVSPHDSPQRSTDYNHRQTLRDAARHKTYFKRDELPGITYGLGWSAACHPSSPGRHYFIDLNQDPPPREGKTFIHDHYKSMSPCQHIHLFHEHGQFVAHEAGPDPQRAMIAQWGYASSTLHHDIRMPAPYDWVEDIPGEPEWEEKTDTRLLHAARPIFHWEKSHRLKMVGLMNNMTAELPPRMHSSADLNLNMMDVAFAGRAHQCEPDVCDQIDANFEFREFQTVSEAANYKYILDVDGNAWSGRFKRLMLANSVIFKATIYPEWYIDRVQPWLHYVPVQMDYSDLYDALVFFRGDEDGIAVQGRKWSKDYWRLEDLQAYFIRSLLEYARLMSVDREAMTYHGPGTE